MSKKAVKPSLKNPFDPPEKVDFTIPGEIAGVAGGYEAAMQEGHELTERPIKSVKIDQIEKQHFKKRMTVWERIRVLTDQEPNILFQNWGKNLDGASLVTGILTIGGRDVALYGHDFTVRAGSYGQDMRGPKITETGWWTLGMSFTRDGRVHYFAHEGVEDVYLTSTDIMPRNFDRRVEVMLPIEDERLKRRIIDEVLAFELDDLTPAEVEDEYRRLADAA